MRACVHARVRARTHTENTYIYLVNVIDPDAYVYRIVHSMSAYAYTSTYIYLVND